MTASDVTARPYEGSDQAGTDRVSDLCEHDRDDRRRLFCRDDRWGCRCYNDIHLQPDELGRELGQALCASLCPAVLDRNIATLDPAELAQSLHKGADPRAVERRRVRAQESDGR